MDWLSDSWHWLLVSQAGWWVGYLLIAAGIILGGGYLVWRFGGVQMGSDPEPQPDPCSTDVIPIVPTEDVGPQPYHASNWLDDCFVSVEDFAKSTDAVTEVIEQVIEVTRTTELVITIPAPEPEPELYPARHRQEDLHSPTQRLDESIRRAKEMAP